MAGRTGTGMVTESVGGHIEYEWPWPVDVQKAVACDRWELRR